MTDRIPVLTIECDEPEGKITRHVYRVEWTPEKLQKFWHQAKQFPTIFGVEIFHDSQTFLDMFFSVDPDTGVWKTDQLFFEVDDMVGLFRVDDIRWPFDASVHYTFFDRRHKGRTVLIREMLKWFFHTYKFHRLSTQIPNYVKDYIRHFVVDIGFIYEGKKRSASVYKGKKYDVNLYGLLPFEIDNKERKDGLAAT